MIEAYRIVENQSQLYPFKATRSGEKAAYVASLLESTKPESPFKEWHPLIATPFGYPLPCPPAYQARFRPPYARRNVLYCSENSLTSLYEHAYHFLRERRHLTGASEAGQRTAFSLSIEGEVADIHGHPEIKSIMDRKDYSASHEFVAKSPDLKVIRYPSCRDPKQGPNHAVLELAALGKEIGDERTLAFYFDQPEQSVFWTEIGLKIYWKDVC